MQRETHQWHLYPLEYLIDISSTVGKQSYHNGKEKDFGEEFNRLLPKCNDRNKKPKQPFSLGKLTNFTRKLANFGTF